MQCSHGPRRHVQAHGERLRGEQALDEVLLKEDLDHLLQDWQQAGVVHPDAALQQRQHVLDLREQLVVLAERVDRVGVHLLHKILLLVAVEVQLADLHRQRLALLLGEREHDCRVHVLLHDHLHNSENVRLRVAPARVLAAPTTRASSADSPTAATTATTAPTAGAPTPAAAFRLTDLRHHFLEVVCPEFSLLVHHEVQAVACSAQGLFRFVWVNEWQGRKC